jgi:hypothetical protein
LIEDLNLRVLTMKILEENRRNVSEYGTSQGSLDKTPKAQDTLINILRELACESNTCIKLFMRRIINKRQNKPLNMFSMKYIESVVDNIC